MKKQIILRGALGIPVGVAVGYLITIFISVIWAGGYYSPCMPELISTMGSEINAVIFQTFLWSLLGMGCGAGSVVWEMENWSLVKQTGIYFSIISALMMPIAYFAFWMEHSFTGFLSYMGIFILIFVFIWIVQFIIGRHNVKRMNERLSETDKERDRLG